MGWLGFFLVGGWGVNGLGTQESVNFFYYESKFKIFFFWGGGGRWGGGVGVVRRTGEQAQTNLLLQLLRSWGHNNALMYKLCP